MLSRTQIFRDYARAFHDVTGLSLALKPLDDVDLPPPANPSDAWSATPDRGGASSEREGGGAAGKRAAPPARFADRCDSTVPVLVGRRPVAHVQIGGLRLHPADRRTFARLARRLFSRGIHVNLCPEEVTDDRPHLLSLAQAETILRLVTAFGRHLGALSRRLAAREERAETPQIARARAYIYEHQAEDISLSDVARAVNMSAFYFCKLFKQMTGLNFTDYLAHLRVEKVKSLLQDPHRRVSEAAFAAGFQSLSQFNRVFHKVTGEAPSTYRARAGRTLRTA